jgi:hypothetical protein
MSHTLEEVRQIALELPEEDRLQLASSLWDSVESDSEADLTWRKEIGEPEPGYNEWLADRVKKSLENNEPGLSTDEAMLRARNSVLAAARTKQSA